jgi:GrpB-like predicted nucleotidyltransferase (UPF0157 family)
MSQLGLQYDEVKLEKHTSAWSKDFSREKEKIEKLNIKNLLYVEHVGSTAVPGMVAKPIIDILVGINRYSDYKKLIKPLSKIGYHFYREPRRYQALFLKKSIDGKTTHHLKVVRYVGKSWRDYLKFRDALRSNKKLFDEYKQLKISLSNVQAIDRKTYTAGKQKLIQKSLENLLK